MTRPGGLNDELAERRHKKLASAPDPIGSPEDAATLERLIGFIQGKMLGSLRLAYRGYGGQLQLSSDLTTELVDIYGLPKLRQAARQAGRGLGWQPKTHLVKGRFFVYDDREIPEDLERLIHRHTADAMDIHATRSLRQVQED